MSFRKIRWAFLYVVGVFLFVAGMMEFFCRVGIIPNEMQRFRKEMRALKGSPKVLIIGDSFTLPQPGSATDLLKDYLSTKGASTLNLGVGGTGPTHYLDQLKVFGPSYAPDLVIVNYYVGNDITDSYMRVTRTKGLRQKLRSWARSSYLVTFLLDARLLYIAHQHLDALGTTLQDEKFKGMNPYLIDMAHVYPNYITTNHLVNDEAGQFGWKVNKQVLMDIRQIAEGLHAKVFFNIFPSTLQVSNLHQEFYRKAGFPVPEGLASADPVPQKLLREFCAAQHMECFDLLPTFRERVQEQGPFYLPNDDHWNLAGNRLAYELIHEQLEQRNLLAR